MSGEFVSEGPPPAVLEGVDARAPLASLAGPVRVQWGCAMVACAPLAFAVIGVSAVRRLVARSTALPASQVGAGAAPSTP